MAISSRRKWKKFKQHAKEYYKLGIAFILFIILVFFFGSKLEKMIRVSENHIIVDGCMDTVSTITVNGKCDVDSILSECKAVIQKYDENFSPTKKYGDIYRANNLLEAEVSDDTIEIIDKSRDFYLDTEGKFDITCGAVAELWNNAISNSVLPDSAEIEIARHTIGYENLKIDKENKIIRKKDATQKITLGAVAKGYISDKLAEYIKTTEALGGLFNLGGNIYAYGKKANGKDWTVGIAAPDNSEDMIGSLSISNKFVITSGDYERYAEINGKRYHHIIDAKTGYPSESGLRSVTIVCDEGFLGDALSTVCFISGLEKSKELCLKYGVGAVFVTNDNKVYYSKELAEIFDQTNSLYTYSAF